MIKLPRIVLTTLLLSQSLPQTALSLDWKVGETSSSQRFVSASGTINDGDAHTLRKLVASPGKTTVVVFNSLGGSVTEAMEMGRDIRRSNAATIVPNGSRCLSACILAFIGGEVRVVSEKGQLGSHQFYWPEGEAPNSAQATQISQSMSSAVLRHFLALGIDPEALTLIMDTPPDDMKVFPQELLERFKLTGQSPLPARPPVLPHGAKREGCPFPESYVNSDPLGLYPACRG